MPTTGRWTEWVAGRSDPRGGLWSKVPLHGRGGRREPGTGGSRVQSYFADLGPPFFPDAPPRADPSRLCGTHDPPRTTPTGSVLGASLHPRGRQRGTGP